MAPWRWRPIWQGLVVAVLAVAGTVYGTLVISRSRIEAETAAGLTEGFGLLAIERDVSISAHEAIAAVTMTMYEGGHEAEVAERLAALRRVVNVAADELGARTASDAWRTTHRDMYVAADNLLQGFDAPRSYGELLSWLDEFLYDFKRVVPTDNRGRWSALLDVATWSQETPLVFRSYLEGAMEREWDLTGREPVDPALSDDLLSVRNDMRRLRESHGEAAASYSMFEEYLLPVEAAEAGEVSSRLVAEIASHPGVRQTDADTPYLLDLTDDPGFESISDLYREQSAWRAEVAALADDLLTHAQDRLQGELNRTARAGMLGRSTIALSVILALVFAIRVIRRRFRIDTELRTALERDVLTGVANRYALFSMAPPRLRDPGYGGFALILLDLDDFKSINDDHGHHIGDRALVEFANALQTVVRSATDIVARVGGDEFVVFLHELADPVREVGIVVDRLRERLEKPVMLEDVPTELHFTAGVAVSKDPVALEDLLVEADLALIEAKEKGRDVAQFFRRKLGRRMTQELSEALGSGELRCAFQPQIDMKTGAIVGLEALARWQRDDRRQVPTRSLIEALDWLGASRDWLHVAMRDIAAAWRLSKDHMEGRIWLNLMGSDVRDCSAEELLGILGGTGVPFERLGVEITDPVDRSQIEKAAVLLGQMREAGVGVALDDVGDDRVPLLHMTELPVDLVKLDRCVVHGIDTQPELRVVVQSLAEMSKRLDRRVLAEGVETVEEEAVLRQLGIRYVQGFLFARPMSVSALTSFYEAPPGTGHNVA